MKEGFSEEDFVQAKCDYINLFVSPHIEKFDGQRKDYMYKYPYYNIYEYLYNNKAIYTCILAVSNKEIKRLATVDTLEVAKNIIKDHGYDFYEKKI